MTNTPKKVDKFVSVFTILITMGGFMKLSKKTAIALAIALNVGFLTQTWAYQNSELSELHSLYAKIMDQNGKENPTAIHKMVNLMQDILKKYPDDLILKDNVLGVYQNAYDNLPSHTLPANWHLPNELKHMRIATRRSTKDETSYSLTLKCVVTKPGIIKQLRITRYPNEVLFDKLAGIGEWQEVPIHTLKSRPTPPNLQLETKMSSKPYESGLYLLTIELKNGSKTNGWFIVDNNMTASASSELLVPSNNQTFKTGNPTFKWTSYYSPEYKSYEKRILWIGANKIESSGHEKIEKWSFYLENPSIQQASVGKEGDFSDTHQHSLENGNYLLQLNYRELRQFGDIEIGRYTTMNRSFKIQQPNA